MSESAIAEAPEATQSPAPADAARDTAAWRLPPLRGPVLPLRRRLADLTAIEREAWEHGYTEGQQAGLEAARKKVEADSVEFDKRVRQLQAILDFMAKPLADLDQQVQRQLATLAGAIARHLVRRELKIQPGEIIAVVRETVALLPAAARDVRVFLHPEDAELVRSRLVTSGAERAWTLVDDPMLSRGGCRVTSESSTIDAQLEQRLGAAMAALLGDERSGASEPSDDP